MSYTPFENFEAFLQEYPANLDNPGWLTNAIINLAHLLYHQNVRIAAKQLEEQQAKIRHLSAPNSDGKKTSMVEAEARAIFETNNEFNKAKLEGEAIQEMINAVKKRADLLEVERR